MNEKVGPDQDTEHIQYTFNSEMFSIVESGYRLKSCRFISQRFEIEQQTTRGSFGNNKKKKKKKSINKMQER